MLSRTPKHILRMKPRLAQILAKGRARREAARREAHQIELRNGEQDRDDGMARVAASSPDFMDRAMAILSGLRSWTGTGEELRVLIGAEVSPNHHNAWGAFVGLAIKDGLIARTGERRRMAIRSSHSRLTDVYVRTPSVY